MGRLVSRDIQRWRKGSWMGCLRYSTPRSSTLHPSSPRDGVSVQVRGGKLGGGKQRTYQVTVTSQAPLSIHWERDEGEDRVEGIEAGLGGARGL